MPLSHLHPVVSRWFEETFGAPTPPQAAGWKHIREGRHTLIAAPTGSGKTLAAFLIAIDDLLTEGAGSPPAAAGTLNDEVRVVYVSPLKALSADIHKNLAEPRREIRQLARDMGYPPVDITAAVRSGDTPQSERAAMLRRPPHILVTTPESLHLLLTAERSREMLRSVRTVIVDEIHAVIESRRGSHLALSLERLAHVSEHPLQRIGLSATQRPIDEVARFLVGTANVDDDGVPDCAIVDEGHTRDSDIALEVTGSPLEAVTSAEHWQEIYDRTAALVREHTTTLVFVNTRRLAERVTRHLAERLGEEHVATHHGSLSKERRLEAETRLKEGSLEALVATASLELGIDIGHVDLVVQLGSPRRIATFLQRVGRSGHTVAGTPKGRIFPLTRDELVEVAAMLREVRRGELDRLVMPPKPLDVLAQQITAEAAAEDWDESALFAAYRNAWPYRTLTRDEYDDVVRMLASGFATRRGRRGTLIHHDAINGRIRGRKRARMVAITSGGAIPENADYRVVVEPEGTFVGTVNEDFAVESMAGDVFQLGNASWRVLRVERGTMRVADAHGVPPNIPFWLGEAPSRSDELSRAVAELRADVEVALAGGAGPVRVSPARSPDTRVNSTVWERPLGVPESLAGGHPRPTPTDDVAASTPRASGSGSPQESDSGPPSGLSERLEIERGSGERTGEARPATAPDTEAAAAWAIRALDLPESAAEQLVTYLAETKRLLGVLPTQKTLVLERFFDDSGGMQLILHSPFGARVNRAWGLALRKRFCRKFNFELQAAATDEGLLLSLGPQHSFPLEEVWQYLHPDGVKDILVQAALDSPLFQVRWRWNANISLAVPRSDMGRKVPPPLQRMQAEDLLAAVFPDAAACLENIAGDREVPDHPLVRQALEDCLEEAMDLPALEALLRRLMAGELNLVARDTPEPSPLASQILNARVFEFLDDAPLEERRAQAVYTRRATEPTSAEDLGALDVAAIERVKEEAWPTADTPDELHDALLLAGFLTDEEMRPEWAPLWDALVASGRVKRLAGHGVPLRVATERAPEAAAALASDDASAPAGDALRELLRGRLEVLGPVTIAELARPAALDEGAVEAALASLENEGAILRGFFTPGRKAPEWCDRRLLARIHRYTLNRLRAEIEPVSTADFMRFLFRWQRVEPGTQAAGAEGLMAVLEQLDGYELPAVAWELDVLPTRCEDYGPELLDALSLGGRVAWGRLTRSNGNGGGTSGPLRTSPMSLFQRENTAHWLALAGSPPVELSTHASAVARVLEAKGASFFTDIVSATGLLKTQVEEALGELAAAGLVSSDGITGLRALLTPSSRRKPVSGGRRRGRVSPYGVDAAGRWALLRSASAETGDGAASVSAETGEGAANVSAETEDGAASVSAETAKSARGISGSATPATPAKPATTVTPAPRGREPSEHVEAFAGALLRRYGVVFRKLLAKEPAAPAWRDLTRVYRRLEARGELRGGRFVAGVTGEQFGLPEAVGVLRAVRREERSGECLGISAADPLNLTGVVTPGERVPTSIGNRVVYRDGVPVAARVAGEVRSLTSEGIDLSAAPAGDPLKRALVRRATGRALRTLEKGLKM